MKKVMVLLAVATVFGGGFYQVNQSKEQAIESKIEQGSVKVVPTEAPKGYNPPETKYLDVVEPQIGDFETMDYVEEIAPTEVQEVVYEEEVYEETSTYEEPTVYTEEHVEVASFEADEDKEAPEYVPSPEPELEEIPSDKAPTDKEEVPEGPTLGLNGQAGPPSEEEIKEAFPEGKY